MRHIVTSGEINQRIPSEAVVPDTVLKKKESRRVAAALTRLLDLTSFTCDDKISSSPKQPWSRLSASQVKKSISPGGYRITIPRQSGIGSSNYPPPPDSTKQDYNGAFAIHTDKLVQRKMGNKVINAAVVKLWPQIRRF